jgi:hypothetical protein
MSREGRIFRLKDIKMQRREFLQITGLVLLGGKAVFDICQKEYAKYIENKIFNELPNYNYLAETITNDNENYSNKGYGIVINDKYITMAHIINDDEFDTLNKETFIRETKLERIVVDWEKDVAVFNVPKSLNLKNFPCKVKTNIKLGEKIYLVGNPFLDGTNVRSGRIIDLDELNKELECTKGCFGIDIVTISGDSGTSLVNSDFELLGLVQSTVNGLGYINRIQHYLEYLG